MSVHLIINNIILDEISKFLCIHHNADCKMGGERI